MRSGLLRHTVTLQRLIAGSPDRDSGGATDDSWTDVDTVRAAIEPLRGRELFAAQQVNSEVTGQIRMRYRADLAVAPSWRVKYGTRLYDIVAVMNSRERNREIVLMVREGPNNG